MFGLTNSSFRCQGRVLTSVLAGLVFSLALLPCDLPAHAAEVLPSKGFPSRPIRIIAGQQAGTPSDRIARLLGEKLSELSGQPVVIENHPGASGTIGAELVAKASPDGYTLLLGGHSNLVLAMVYGVDARYDALRDFTPIGRIAAVPFALAVNQDVPVGTVQQLIAYAKAHPRKLTFASNGIGTMSQLGMDLLMATSGTEMLAVPYSGASTALSDVIAGRVDIMFTDYAVLAPHIGAKRLRGLGMGSARRTAAAPDFPTIAEQGIEGFAVNPWYGLVAPAGISPEVLARLTGLLTEIRGLPEVRQRLERFGYEPLDDSPEQFRKTIASEIRQYSQLVAKGSEIKKN